MHIEMRSAPAAIILSTKRSRLCSVSWSSIPRRHFTVTGRCGRVAHRTDAVGDQIGLRHQAGAEAPGLHPIGRAADIEVDLVIAEGRRDPRGFRQFRRIGSAELHGQRVLDVRESQATARGRRGR